ncbi:MAG: ABC transporter permease [Brucellaceae bacterium]|jgi:ABC-type nitrate/sulfonate/bicarbonate transport system permease component|nr:ABC transporter permease [Brucellaceae bacterium]
MSVYQAAEADCTQSVRKSSAHLSRVLPAILSVGAVFLFWESYVALSGIASSVLPAPSRILQQIVLHRQALWDNTVPTIRATLIGFSCSVVTACLLSVLIDRYIWLRRALFPVFIISQTLPLIAIAPLIVLWFGFGLLPKILLVSLVTFFPMLVALVQGYASTDKEIEHLLSSMGAGRWTIFRLARIPSALPYFFAGLRISITYAVVGAIFAEYAGAFKGLGIYILNAKNNFRPDLVLAAVFISATLTLSLFGLTYLIQKWVAPWLKTERGAE